MSGSVTVPQVGAGASTTPSVKVTAAQVPTTDAEFRKFVVAVGLKADSLRSIAYALKLDVDCSLDRDVAYIARDLLANATRGKRVDRLVASVVAEVNSRELSQTDPVLNPRGALELFQVPLSGRELAVWAKGHLSDDELMMVADRTGLSRFIAEQRGVGARVLAMLKSVDQVGGLDVLRRGLLEVFNMKVRENAPPMSPPRPLSYSPNELTVALFDDCTLEGLKAVSEKAGVASHLPSRMPRRLLYAHELVGYFDAREAVGRLVKAARSLLPGVVVESGGLSDYTSPTAVPLSLGGDVPTKTQPGVSVVPDELWGDGMGPPPKKTRDDP